MRDYTKIQAWQLADDLTVAIYERTRSFPREELHGLTSQLRRAAHSIPANIAKGSARASKRDYPHFLHIACGSLAETRYFLHLASCLGILDLKESESRRQQTQSAFACLYGLFRAVEKETGKLARIAAAATSMVVLALGHFPFRVAGF